jgi:hypothetical protein
MVIIIADHKPKSTSTAPSAMAVVGNNGDGGGRLAIHGPEVYSLA